MLQKPETIQDGFRLLDGFRARVISDVAAIVEELSKTSQRNPVRLQAVCARIDVLSRDYLGFLSQLNDVRAQAEMRASSNEAFLDVRREWGVLHARSSLFRVELARWHDVRDLVYQQVNPKRRKLYFPDANLSDITMSQTLASDDIFNWLHAVFNPHEQSDYARDRECFADIGLYNSEFHAHMHAAYRLLLAMQLPRPVRFLDVGCGVGMKVYAALRYFDDTTGFDFDPVYVKAGKRFLKRDAKVKSRIFEQDALTYDGYAGFDVIYFYRPISDENALVEMERRIAEHARPGTILIAPYKSFSRRFQDYGCGQVAGSVYLTQTPQKKADGWRRKAERVGPYILRNDDSPLKTVWSPVLNASRANGYDLPSLYKKPKY